LVSFLERKLNVLWLFQTNLKKKDTILIVWNADEFIVCL